MKNSLALVGLIQLFPGQRSSAGEGIFASRKMAGEEGFVTIVTVLMMLLLLTIVGVSAINNAILETAVVRNNAIYTRSFYLAESAGYEAAQRLENAALTVTDPTLSTDPAFAWIIPLATDMTKRSSWINDQGTADYSDDVWLNSVRPEVFYTTVPGNPSNLEILLPGTYTADDIRLASNFQGVAQGSSLKVTGQQGRLYGFNVYGMYSNLSQGLGEVFIEMGYRKRF